MYKRILIPLDGSDLAEQVLPYARLVAKALQTQIELLQVFESVPEEWADPAHGRYIDQLSSSYRNQALEYLERVAAPLRQEGITVTCSAHEGDAAEMIISQASVVSDTLIAMSTHGRAGFARWVIGSVTDKVLHGTNNPLLVVRSQEEPYDSEKQIENVIVPLDGSPLSEEVLPHAIALAKALAASVTLLQAVNVPYYVPMDYPASIYDDLIRETTTGAEEYLERMSQQLLAEGVSRTDQRVIERDPAGAILDVAGETTSSLVAMSTHGHSGLGRWVMGSVADRVVRHSVGPVLVIRPAS